MTADRPKFQDPRLGNVTPSYDDNNNSTQNAALRGASLAFGKPPVKPKPKTSNYSGTNGALAAAKGAGRAAASRTVSSSSTRWESDVDERLAYQNTGSSVGGRSYTGPVERPSIQQRLSQYGGAAHLQPHGGEQGRSASFIAATLAASRSVSLSPNPTGQSQVSNAELRRPQGYTTRSPSDRSISSSKSSEQALDTKSIPPTTSLIRKFEQNAPPTAVKGAGVKRSAKSGTVKTPSTKSSSDRIRAQSPSALSARPTTSSGGPPKLTLAQIQRLSEESEAQKPPSPPPSARNPSMSTSKPILIPTKTKEKPNPREAEKEDEASSDDSFVSASDHKLSFRAVLAQKRRLTSPSTHSLDTQATIDSMANAIVASSLASSRAASPSKSSLQSSIFPPLPPPRRNGRQHRLFHKDNSRTPSPAKPTGMRTTMRKPKSKDSLDEGEKRRGKRNIVKKHPNKHHEGDRKRWRDAVTERERKRYEAVWASNKGLYLSSSGVPGSEYCVCNLVARDIFSRSRLHVEVLEEVYALVDRSENRMLEKEEFVVGLWLIDQRLKGRKLPIRVSDSVWKSAGALNGIKVKKVGK